MNLRSLTWPAVVVILAVLAVVAGLAYLKLDTTAILGVLAALGIGGVAVQNASTSADVRNVQQQTNGNTSTLLDIIRQQGEMLARANPVEPLDTSRYQVQSTPAHGSVRDAVYRGEQTATVEINAPAPEGPTT